MSNIFRFLKGAVFFAITGLVMSIFLLSFFIQNFEFAYAAPNLQINYQGKLTGPTNIAVADGTYHMRFWLLTSPTAATTTAVWTEDRSTAAGDRITVRNGLFSVMLGSSTALTSVDFNQTLYLGVEVGGAGGSPSWDGEMSPRKVLGTVPAAFEADKLDGLTSAQFLRSDTSTTLSSTSASTLLTITQSGTGDILNIFDGATEVFSILDGGAVGIGTSSPSSNYKLSVGGASHFGGNVTATGTLTVSGTSNFASILASGSSTIGGGTQETGLTVNGGATTTGNAYIAGNLGVGTPAPSTKLHITQTAGASTRESLFRADVSDAANDFFFISNGTSVDSRMYPVFGGMVNSVATLPHLGFQGFVTSANDASDSSTFGLVDFMGVRSTNIQDPLSGTLSTVVNRKLFTFRNNSAFLMTILAGGNVGIGTTTPNWTLNVASATPYFAITDTDAGTDEKHWILSNLGGIFTIGTSTDALTATSSLFAITQSSTTLARPFSVTGTGTSTAVNGFNITDGCFAIDNTCLSSGGASTFLDLSDTDQSAFTANRIIHTNSGGTGLTDTAGFVFTGTNFGVGSSSPTSKLTVGGGDIHVGGIITSTSTATSTFTGDVDLNDLAVGGKLYTGGTPGTNGMVLQTTGTGVQWVTPSVPGSFGTTSIDTSSELDTIVTDDTGSGSLVFGTDATLSSTTLSASTTLTNATSSTFATTRLTIGGDVFDELVGDGLDISAGDLIFDCSDVVGTALTCTGEDIGVTADAIGDTQLAFNTGQHLTTTSDVTFSEATTTIFSTTLIQATTSTSTNLFAHKALFNQATTSVVAIGSSGVQLSNDGDGMLIMTGLGNGNDEDLRWNFDDAAGGSNFVDVTSGTSVSTINFSSIALQESGIAVLNNDEIDGSSELAAIMDDEVGSSGGGLLVFNNAPYFTGNVGVGTSSPFAKLSVHAAAGDTNQTLFAIGSSTVSATTTLFSVDNRGFVTMGDSAGVGDATFQVGPDLDAWSLGYSSSTKNFIIASSTNLSASVALTIAKGTNNVGIGTTSPHAALSLTTSATTGLGSLFDYRTLTSGTGLQIEVNSNTMTTAGRGFKYYDTAFSALNFEINEFGMTGIRRFGSLDGSTALEVGTGFDSFVGIAVQANSATQSGSLQEWRGSSGAVLSAISPVGYLGVGTTSAGALIHVKDATNSSSTRQLLLQNEGSGNETAALAFQVSYPGEYTVIAPKGGIAYQRNAANGRGDLIFYNRGTSDTKQYDSADARLTLLNGGTIKFNSGLGTGAGGNYLCIDTTTFEVLRGNGVSCTASSRRYKEDIEDLDYGLDEVMAMRPVTFKYKPEVNSGSSTHLGFIAEEIEEIIPELVTYNNDGAVQGLDYPVFSSVLVKSIQDMNLNLLAITGELGSSSSESEDFAEAFFSNLFERITAWLGDAENQISNVFFGEVHTGLLCVGETCVTEDELQALISADNNPPGPAPEPAESSEGESQPEPTPEPEPAESSEGEPPPETTPEVIEEPSPEQTSEPEPAAEDPV